MEGNTSQIASIDAYIAQFPDGVQKTLQDLRRVIRAAAPDAAERIGYAMPAFYLRGNLVYFAAFKKHIGFYPGASGVAAFEGELKGYKHAKGSVQFPIGKPLPYELITRIVAYRVRENTGGRGDGPFAKAIAGSQRAMPRD